MCVFVLVFTHQFILCVAHSSFHAHQVSHCCEEKGGAEELNIPRGNLCLKGGGMSEV